MKNLLVINSSPNFETSASRKLAADFTVRWTAKNPQGRVHHRDLAADQPPHLDQQMIGAFYTPADQRSAEQKLAIAYSETQVAELREADEIVIASPMHNFGISSVLKAWIDQVARVGETFQYTENGPVGLLKGKKVYVLTARGGNYAEGSPAAAMDGQEPYLRTVLAFLGLDDVTFVHSHGMSGDEDRRTATLAESGKAIETLIAAAA